MGKRQRRIRARSAPGQVAGAANESSGSQPIDEKRPAQHAFSQKAPVPGPPTVAAGPDAASEEQFHASSRGTLLDEAGGGCGCEPLLDAAAPEDGLPTGDNIGPARHVRPSAGGDAATAIHAVRGPS